jgi:CheY-like chemotaxis protein
MPLPAIQSALRGRRILVVEDDYLFADDLSHELRADGVEILGPVASIEGALDVLDRESPPDFAILDVNLGGEMVYPLADLLRARGIPYLFATAYGRQDLPPAYAEVPVWEKPVDVRRIAEALARGPRLPQEPR